MNSDWWPTGLAHIPEEDPWGSDYVVVAEIRSFDEDPHPGRRKSFTALIPIGEVEELEKNLARLNQSVSTSGPHPSAHEDYAYKPKFWVEGTNLPSRYYEPLVLSWSSHDKTVLLPDPGFLMTYGLVPRALGNGLISWDDPAKPIEDVVKVSGPSIYRFPNATTAHVLIRNDYLQDYLTLRHMALAQVFWEMRWREADKSIEEALSADAEATEISFPDRTIQLNRYHEDRDIVGAQVWGGRLIAFPGSLPITENSLENEGLIWPGFAEPVTESIAAQMTLSDYVYVDDAVLGEFEGRPEYRINPTSGSVSFGTQWTVNFSDRVGRNLIRVEIKKVYEGVPPHATRHWHRFAVAPLPDRAYPAALSERNIATRAKDIAYGLANVGERLADLATVVGLEKLRPEDFVGLRKAALDYQGWWTLPETDSISRHVPLKWPVDAFLERCVSLNKLLVEGLSEGNMRMLLHNLGVPDEAVADLGGSLKLLDLVVRLAQVANTSGLKLSVDGKRIWRRLETNGTHPPRPIARLFALYDLRLLKAHKGGDPEKLRGVLERFDVLPGEEAPGFGRIADKVYDALGTELAEIAAKIGAAIQ